MTKIEFAKSEIERLQKKLDYYEKNWEIVIRNMESGEIKELKELCISWENTIAIFEDYLSNEEAIKALEQELKWILISERLPKSAGVYIVSRWFSDGEEKAILTDACYFDGTETWHDDTRINHGRSYLDNKIVAWMPLPKPYKESEVEE